MHDASDGIDYHHHAHMPSDMALRVKALETVLTEKGLVDPAAIDAIVETFETRVGPHIGAAVVARAWTDPDFRARLLADGTAACAEMGALGEQTTHVVAVENTATTHNVVVCTLCSCYPWMLLGLPPAWYKSDAYRARIVREPRAVLAEFGLALGEEVAIRVWDSTAEIRYLVIPERPAGTDGLDAGALAPRVTRDMMIGTAR